MIEKFVKLHMEIETVKAAITSLQDYIENLDKKIDLGFKELFQEGYKDTVNEAINYHQHFPYPKKRSQDVLEKYYMNLLRWATESSRNPLVSGIDNSTNDILCQQVFSNGLYCNINSIVNYTTQKFGIPHPGKLANIVIWENSISIFLEFIKHNPEFEVPETINDRIKIFKQIFHIELKYLILY